MPEKKNLRTIAVVLLMSAALSALGWSYLRIDRQLEVGGKYIFNAGNKVVVVDLDNPDSRVPGDLIVRKLGIAGLAIPNEFGDVVLYLIPGIPQDYLDLPLELPHFGNIVFVEDLNEEPKFRLIGEGHDPKFSPNSKKITYTSNEGVVVVDLDEEFKSEVVIDDAWRFTGAVWKSDESMLYTDREENLVELNLGEPKTKNIVLAGYQALAIHETKLLCKTLDGDEFEIYDLENKAFVQFAGPPYVSGKAFWDESGAGFFYSKRSYPLLLLSETTSIHFFDIESEQSHLIAMDTPFFGGQEISNLEFLEPLIKNISGLVKE